MSHPTGRARALSFISATTLAVVGSFAAFVPAASAHTPTASATCTTLSVDLTAYSAPKPGTPAVTHTEWHYVWTSTTFGGLKDNQQPSMSVAGVWSHGANHGGGYFTQIFTTNGTYKTAPSNVSNGSWSQGSSVVVTDSPAVAADSTPNHVKVVTAGATRADVDFGSSYSNTFAFADKYAANAWSVQVTAYDDPTGSKGFTKTLTGTSTPCPDGVPTTHKVTLCHATDSNTNPYVSITVDDDAVFKQGHDGHDGPVWNASLKASHTKWGDIIPAFNYEVVENHVVVTKHYDGKNLPAGQSILDAGCSVTPETVTPVAPSITQPTCDGTSNVDGSFTLPTTEGITYTKSGNVVTATANEGYTLKAASNGWVGNASSQTFTVNYDNTPDCTIHVSGSVLAVPESCTGEAQHGDGAIVVTAVDGIEYHLGSADGALLTGSTPEVAGTYTVYEVASDTHHTVDTVTVTVKVESAGACHTPTANPGGTVTLECPKSALAFHLTNTGDATATFTVYVNGEKNRDVTLEGGADTYFEVFGLAEDSTTNVKVVSGEKTILDQDVVANCNNPGAEIINASYNCDKNSLGFHLTNYGALGPITLSVYVDGEHNRDVTLAAGEDTYFEVFNLSENASHNAKVTFGDDVVLDKTFTVDCVVDHYSNPAASITTSCGSATVNLSDLEKDTDYRSQLDGSTFVIKDGTTVLDTVTLPNDESESSTWSKTYTFGEDTGDHVITVTVGDDVIASATAHSDCLPNVVVVTGVSFQDSTCLPNYGGSSHTASYTIPADAHVTYYLNMSDTPLTPGVHAVADGDTVVIRASANEGYVLGEDSVSTFQHTFVTPNCPIYTPPTTPPVTTPPVTTPPTTTPPVTTPPTTTPPTTTPPVTTPPSTTPAPTTPAPKPTTSKPVPPVVPPVTPPGLPFTGSNIAAIGGIGAALLIIGALALVVANRRRRPTSN